MARSLEIDSLTLTETLATVQFHDGVNAGTGIAVGRVRDHVYATALLVPSMVHAGQAYIVVGTWATEAEARAHANRIWQDKVDTGSLCGVANCPR